MMTLCVVVEAKAVVVPTENKTAAAVIVVSVFFIFSSLLPARLADGFGKEIFPYRCNTSIFTPKLVPPCRCERLRLAYNQRNMASCHNSLLKNWIEQIVYTLVGSFVVGDRPT